MAGQGITNTIEVNIRDTDGDNNWHVTGSTAVEYYSHFLLISLSVSLPPSPWQSPDIDWLSLSFVTQAVLGLCCCNIGQGGLVLYRVYV